MSRTRKHRILIFLSFYLPGYKAGGPIRTILNMVEQLSDEYEFLIVTRDRDLGDKKAYDEVLANQWVTVNNAKVFYSSPENLTIKYFSKLINDTEFDVLYLNSFFDPVFTLKPLIARYLGKITKSSLILAPRGEFSKGALNLKSWKKNIYILLVRFCGLYKNIIWQASSVHELEDIKRAFHVANSDIRIALDLPEKRAVQRAVVKSYDVAPNIANHLRIVFLSRISPMKNLDYALKVLSDVHVDVIFDIYGPQEDIEYWGMCEALIEKLPRNISCNYRGTIHPDDVAQSFSEYDLFFFPTRGENYGHVIAESLSVGTPVLVSDKTPWRNLQIDKLGMELPLDNPDAFVHFIEVASRATAQIKNQMRVMVKSKALDRLANPEVLDSNRNLLLSVIDQSGGSNI